MNDDLIFVCCFFGFILFLALAVFLDFKISDFIRNREKAKRHKEHPEFFRLYDEYDEKGDTARRFYNKEISPRKCKVDSMLKEERYWSQEAREKKMEELEKLRREICFAEDTYKYMNRETDNARQKVVEYVRTHNIKWAGVWE